MISDLKAALDAIKIISDLLKENKPIANHNELVSAVVEAKSKLIDAQDSVLDYQARYKALTDRISKLEEELSGKDKFDREISRYVLYELKSGMLVYMIKPEYQEIGKPHYICTDCANNRKISLYQPVLNGTRLVCDSCKKNVITGSRDR